MSDVALDKNIFDLAYLAACAVQSQTPDAERVSKMDLDAIYRLSQQHLLVSACATALEAADVHDERFVQARAKAMRKVILLDTERAEIFRLMDEKKIWHLPLKGCVLKDLYPSIGMRQMADNDILFDASRADDVREIFESRGFDVDLFGLGNHDVYMKDPVYNYEMHRELFTPGVNEEDDLRLAYYRDVERLLIPDDDGSFGRHLSDEDFYVYFLAHEYKHYSYSGIGIRALLDTFVFLKAREATLDTDYLARQLETLKLTDFERRNRVLSKHLFGEEELSEEDLRTLGYMAASGIYGTRRNVMNNLYEAQGGSAKFLLSRIFLPYKAMTINYPVLKRYPALLPACWVHRIVKAGLTKPKEITREIKFAFSDRDGEVHSHLN